MPATAPTPLTVSELSRQLKDVLNGTFPDVLLRGEIANFTAHRSGHWYFSLQDPGATISCVMFRGHNQRVRFRPKVGDDVVLTGQLDVYAPAGRVNLVARRMQKAGEGDAQAKLDALKQKLQAEGLFAEERKRPLPALPRGIGVATSGSGAAFHDIDKVLARRFPSVPVYLASCRVQGPGAADSVVDALRLLWEHGGSDVIIVGRGGGSREDLAAFDDEALARAIAASPVPVVSAVGHEVDVSVADLVADVRAATPSHAAELVVPEADALAAWVGEQLLRMRRRLSDDLAARRRHLRALRLRDPRQRLADARIRCDELSDRLVRAADRDLLRRQQRLGAVASHLDALSPLRVLERGYAVALHDGQAVREAASLAPGDLLDLRLHRGAATVQVQAVRPAPADRAE
ncbi:MAG: exodeoxyribonuclease VII large subunit [Alphaproteobacteria bacterium]|nr:exodeoxyribonuclease VII large subunit [Alphaproteobacteria bacterium]